MRHVTQVVIVWDYVNGILSSSLTHCGLVTPLAIWVNIGSGNGLLPDSTKPLPEPMLIYHQ